MPSRCRLPFEEDYFGLALCRWKQVPKALRLLSALLRGRFVMLLHDLFAIAALLGSLSKTVEARHEIGDL